MIGLVRVLPPSQGRVGSAQVPALPTPPALRFTGFAVFCDTQADVELTVSWYADLCLVRPGAPLGLIARAEDCAMSLAALDRSLAFLLDPSKAIGRVLPQEALQQLRAKSVEGRLLEEIIGREGQHVRTEEETLRALVVAAARGGTLASAGSDLGVSAECVRRRLAGVGLSARNMKREVRALAYELRLALGLDRDSALLAGGWSDHEQRRKFMSRLSRPD